MAASLLDLNDDQRNLLGIPGAQVMTIQQPDPNVPDIGQGAADVYNKVTDYIERQQQQAASEGLWEGGGLLSGGHPTAKGLLAAGSEYANSILAGTITPRLSGGRAL